MKSKRGGARKGSGRKKLQDPKQPISLFVEGSKIEILGGVEPTKDFCYEKINEKIKEKL